MLEKFTAVINERQHPWVFLLTVNGSMMKRTATTGKGAV
jgi:hypothetical protein